MVVAPLELLNPEQEFDSIPTHVTIFPWFDLETKYWNQFDAEMQEVMEQTVAPTIVGGDSVFFGDNEDIEARRLNALSPTFNPINGFNIHAGVHNAVHAYGDNFDTTYTGVVWRPHVTNSDQFQLAYGEEIAIESLAVIERRENQRRKLVKAVYRWGNV